MSEPITAPTNISEGGGPAIEPPSIGGPAKPFEGLDGKRYESTAMPAGKPRQTRRRAPAAAGLTPTDAPQEAAAQVGAQPVQQPTQEADQELPRPTGLEALRHPGESDADFYPRIHQEDRARIRNLERSHDDQRGRAEQALREAAAEIQRLRSLVEPVVTRQAQEDQQRQQEEAMARIPNRETQRDEYNTLLNETILQRQLAWEAEQRRLQAEALQQNQQREEQDRLEAYLADRDEGIQTEMSEAMQADPGLAQIVQSHLALTAYQLRAYDPEATDEEIESVVYLTHLREMVEAKNRGMPIADYYRQQALLIQQTAAAFTGQAPANGNGAQPAVQPPTQAASAQTSRPSAQDSPAVGSPTGARVAREAARSATASGGPGRPGGAPGGVDIPTRAFKSEDEYVKAGLRGQFSEDWIQHALGKPSGEGRGRRR